MPRLPRRALTVQSPDLGLVMTYGERHYAGISTRLLHQGWYYMHVSATDLVEADVGEAALAEASPGAPGAPPRLSIIVRVSLGRAVARHSLQYLWAIVLFVLECCIL